MRALFALLLLTLVPVCSRMLFHWLRRSGPGPAEKSGRAKRTVVDSTLRGGIPAEEAERLIVTGRMTAMLAPGEYQDLMAQLADLDEERSTVWVPESHGE